MVQTRSPEHRVLKAAVANPKIAGIVLVNTGVDPEATADPQYAAQFYLKRSARNPKAWKNLFTGKVRILDLVRTFAAAGLQVLRRGFRGAACDPRSRGTASWSCSARALRGPTRIRSPAVDDSYAG